MTPTPLRSALSLVALLAACAPGSAPSGPLPATTRELWRGTVGAHDVVLNGVVDGFAVRGFDPDGAGDHWRLHVDVVTTTLVDTRGSVGRDEGGADDDPAPLRHRLDHLAIQPCPIEAPGAGSASAPGSAGGTAPPGLAFRVETQWSALWAFNEGIIRTPLPGVGGEACPAVAFDPDTIAATTQDRRACLWLDNAGYHDVAARCLFAARSHPGTVTDDGTPYRAMVALYRADTTREDALVTAAVDAVFTTPPDRPLDLGVLAESEAQGRFLTRLAEKCATDPACTGLVFTRAEGGLRPPNASMPFDPSVCAPGTALATSRLAAGDDIDSLRILRHLSACPVTPAFDTLLADALGRTARIGAAPVSRPYPECPGLAPADSCDALALVAAHAATASCAPLTLERARVIAAAPHTPFDPKLDAPLDAALRVLATCDAPAFEVAITGQTGAGASVEFHDGERSLRKAYGR